MRPSVRDTGGLEGGVGYRFESIIVLSAVWRRGVIGPALKSRVILAMIEVRLSASSALECRGSDGCCRLDGLSRWMSALTVAELFGVGRVWWGIRGGGVPLTTDADEVRGLVILPSGTACC